MAEFCPTCARQMGFEPKTLDRGGICEGCGATGPTRNSQWTPSQIAVLVIILLSTIIAATSCKQPAPKKDLLSQPWMLGNKISFKPVVTTTYYKQGESPLKLSKGDYSTSNGQVLIIKGHQYVVNAPTDSMLIISDENTASTYYLPGNSYWSK